MPCASTYASKARVSWLSASKSAVEAVDAWCRVHPPDSSRMTPGARRWPEVEVSGGITLATARSYAETGVDYLSIGALTHSAPALNLSLEIEDVG